jgi:hypothetical protein
MGPEEFAQAYPTIVDWLRTYDGNFPMYQSFQRQFRANGTLSEKQRACVERAINRQRSKEVVSGNYKPQDRITIKSWLARKLAEERNLKIFFRNLEIVEYHKETARAIETTVKFVSEVATCCHVCGRPLDTDVSRACGIGPICAVNIGLQQPTLDNAKDILKGLDEMAKTMGNIRLWIPKSQIVSPFERDDEEARIALLEDDL